MIINMIFNILLLIILIPLMTNPEINAVLYNRHDKPIFFIGCDKLYGNHLTDIKRVLYPNSFQKFQITTTIINDHIISGKCYYTVPIISPTDTIKFVPLQIQYHLNTLSGNEYYGILNSDYYDVYVNMFNSHRAIYAIN